MSTATMRAHETAANKSKEKIVQVCMLKKKTRQKPSYISYVTAGCLEWVPVSEAQEETSELAGAVPDGFWSVVLKDLKIGSDSILRSADSSFR